jgi:UDP-N-acetylmuramoylalanine--D-glutamate ligase
MKITELKDKKIAVLGLGIEGLALYDFLRDKVASLAVLDQRDKEELVTKVEPENLGAIKRLLEDDKIIKYLGPEYLSHLEEFKVIFRSPGISCFNPKIVEAKKSGVEISSQIKLFFANSPAKIIGVTGTKGKGTTASLIYQIFNYDFSKLERNPKNRKIYLAGNIGCPAITFLDKLKPEDLVVLELSSFQLMDLDVSPNVSVVTNLLSEHLDYHDNISEYVEAKYNIISHQKEGDLAILNYDSTFESGFLESIKSQIQYFGKSSNGKLKAFLRKIKNNSTEVVLKLEREEVVCRDDEIQLVGQHNLENIAAAALATRNFGVPIEKIRKAVKEFRGLPHRLEFVRELYGVWYIDDSFGTNPGPTIAAIRSFSQNKILILGGSSKGADFGEMAEEITKGGVKAVVLIGSEAPKIKDALLKVKYQGQIVDGGTTMREIVQNARSRAIAGDVIILSPACASFGLFKNYKDRGEQFKRAVLDL